MTMELLPIRTLYIHQPSQLTMNSVICHDAMASQGNCGSVITNGHVFEVDMSETKMVNRHTVLHNFHVYVGT